MNVLERFAKVDFVPGSTEHVRKLLLLENIKVSIITFISYIIGFISIFISLYMTISILIHLRFNNN